MQRQSYYQGNRNGNTRNNPNLRDDSRITVYYDGKPSNSAEREKPICMVLKSSGQIIRFAETEAFDLLMDMTKALRWKHNRSRRF